MDAFCTFAQDCLVCESVLKCIPYEKLYNRGGTSRWIAISLANGVRLVSPEEGGPHFTGIALGDLAERVRAHHWAMTGDEISRELAYAQIARGASDFSLRVCRIGNVPTVTGIGLLLDAEEKESLLFRAGMPRNSSAPARERKF